MWPTGASSFKEAVIIETEVYHTLKCPRCTRVCAKPKEYTHGCSRGTVRTSAMLIAAAGVRRTAVNKNLTPITSTDPTDRCSSEVYLSLYGMCGYAAGVASKTMLRLMRRTDPLLAEKEGSPKLKDRLAPRRLSGKSRRGSADEEQRKFDVVTECHGTRIRSPTARSQRTAVPMLKLQELVGTRPN